MAPRFETANVPVVVNRKQIVIEAITSLCALLTSVITLIMVFFNKVLSINLAESKEVTVFELPDIVDSFHRMITKLGIGDRAEIAEGFSDLEFASSMFVILSFVIASLLVLHILFLVFGKGKWIKATSITVTILYLSFLILLYIFASEVSGSVGEVNFIIFTLPNVVSVESTALYTLIPLALCIISSFVYSHYKMKN